MESKVVIVTGASRGIGLAVAETLLAASHKVVLVSRSADKLQQLKEQYPSKVAYLAADMTLADTAWRATELAILTFGKIDGVVVNHGVLSPMTRIENASVEEWKKLYDANFFSALALTKETIPHLRASKGRIVFVSSGAATSAYTSWGAYGSSKAALNSLAKHVGVEEPVITSVAISPGRVDTDMQKELREKGTEMAKKDYETFKTDFEEGRLIKPEQSGRVIAKLSVDAKPELSGKYFKWDAAELAEYR
ncbi:NAD(P)-binding protein [Parathielavia appendiculata]|uniref:NAD(P)-binding protein n=1 Tax=Parathielavia appendiculata TaxID=2587402 RepID=A0AAN6U310_9PEZI|nr:NAD(P)-binding protein [Parathielavia appendiculata]